mgnify:CR=1 FL=1
MAISNIPFSVQEDSLMKELDGHMDKVLSEMNDSNSFDEFLERLEDEISKDTD